ncbi:MAG: restriction endonuclease [Candidatus Paceibacterota bacterium]
MENSKKIQAVVFFSCIFWLLAFCYVVFLWATNSPKIVLGLIYGISFSAVVALLLILFKIEDLNEQKMKGVKTIKKDLSFSNLNPEAFENLLIRLFGAMGYIVECTKKNKIKAFILYKNKAKAFVLFTCDNDLDDQKAISQIKAEIKESNYQKGIYVCIAKISKKAADRAEANNIDIVDKKYLRELLESYLGERWN